MLGLKRLIRWRNTNVRWCSASASLERVLARGVYWLWDPLARLTVQVYDVTRAGA